MIDVLEKQDEYLPLFSCLEYKLKRRIPFNYALWGCYDAHPLPMGTKRLIEECFNTELGDQLQEEAGRVTNSVWPDVKKSVPWLVFNGVSLRVLQEKFKIIPKLLCEWYQGDKKIPYCAENANIMSSCINTV
ncbi:hypothetical protein OESDEN_03167 [Oesophagostomum dentatum]|uniref:Uncharacterized protein n=1 Tax=Oesophagostomum dentatum TaxID=61180 RepID=A0A0B1TLZ6_OESDE|nr:hypothetical protein OESDEN_03167 [Oesophagostomum dentatum]